MDLVSFSLIASMFFVYALMSTLKSYIYVGLTNDFARRFHEHNSGQNRTTKPYLPFKKLLLETYPTRISARKREKFLKSGIGKEHLKSLETNVRNVEVVNLPAGRQDW